jgi:hypothetical protein
MTLKQNICAYFFTLIFSLCAVGSATAVYAQADTTATDTTEVKVKKKDLAGHQLCIGADIFHPIIGIWQKDRSAYEIAADYYLRNEYFAVCELGWGSSEMNYPDLKYSTTNQFLRAGFNKSVLTREKPSDWDMMLIGFRLGAAAINRSTANYTIIDSLWGNSPGTTNGKTFGALWVEITAGMRVELVKGFCAGWNIRGKFLMNGAAFKDLAPLYVAGYGRGDKNSIFDFNMYLSYAIRWDRQGVGVGKKK